PFMNLYLCSFTFIFFFNHPSTTDIYTLSLHDALPISIKAEAHIWPPNSEAEAYKLGNKAAARQGFYFYRNDRLIQAGGWNGVVRSEEHTSELQSRFDLVCRLLLEKKKKTQKIITQL